MYDTRKHIDRVPFLYPKDIRFPFAIHFKLIHMKKWNGNAFNGERGRLNWKQIELKVSFQIVSMFVRCIMLGVERTVGGEM